MGNTKSGRQQVPRCTRNDNQKNKSNDSATDATCTKTNLPCKSRTVDSKPLSSPSADDQCRDMKCLGLTLWIVLFIGSPLAAQKTLHEQFDEAFTAMRRGDSASVIDIVKPIVRSNTLQGADRGKAWILLGFAYKAEGQYLPAQSAYEKAISILKDDPLATKDYALVLETSGALYREMGEFTFARNLQLQSLQLFKKSQDHAAITRALVGLSDLSLDQGDAKGAERYLLQVEAESRLTADLDDDDRSYILLAQGRLALQRQDTDTAIADYRQSLDLFRNRHGEETPMSGWGYVMLGDAYAKAGRRAEALQALWQGVHLLDRTAGRKDSRYLIAEVVYARVLDQVGRHTEAAQYRAEGERAIQRQCSGCTISVDSLRQTGGIGDVETLR
ncbi:Tetratricopeptide TPR_2 repeat-containing protein [Granulicella mallensis MP5ACTX8]|uniref:Tetratricopeptide TPR_2 repeat-containing protein n=2 Tax=Granulicella mallensis TaxID=940614 RepID=G8NRZ1_GRAMM|nr:Tetratricopeptide TPR_2 repeat-containing protein [Granulicella mallensis MP5ACTX8]